MGKYTVALLRPRRMSDESFPDAVENDVYYAHINEGIGARAAIKPAQREVAKADNRDWKEHIKACYLEKLKPDEYKVLGVFEGHIVPVLWNWQL